MDELSRAASGRSTRRQTTNRPDSVFPEFWHGASVPERQRHRARERELQAARERRRTAALNKWHRLDLDVDCLSAPAHDGPQWAFVDRRVVTDACTGEVIFDEDTRDMTDVSKI